MVYRLFLIIGLICLVLPGCGSNSVETDIIGEWRGITPKQDLTFHEDGTVEMKGHEHGAYEGTYTITDGNRLTCEFSRLSQQIKCIAQIKGDELILVFESGRKENYVRK